MKKIYLFFLLLFGLGLIAGAQSPVVSFVPNEGQWKEPFLYKGQSAFADFYLEKQGITYVVGAPDNFQKIEDYKLLKTPKDQPVILNYHAYQMNWIGGNQNSQVQAGSKQSYYANYFLGNDPQRWKGHVGVFGNIVYKEVYQNIDLEIHSDKGLPKYDWVVKPGGDPDKIQLQFKGLNGMNLKSGDLVLETSVGDVTELKPYVFQYDAEGNRVEIKAKYRLIGNQLSFDFPRGYDASRNLIIDPTIIFATLTGSTSDNWGFSATYDNQGNLYAAGITNGNGYPVTLGAFQTSFGGGTNSTHMMACDVAISKFNATGTGLIYSTYLGGNQNDIPHSLIVDNSGHLIVAGKTKSSNFPTTANSYDPSYNGGYDIFLAKFNTDGTALDAATYVGGSGDDGVNVDTILEADQNTLKYNYGDNSRSEVIIDRSDNVYLASSTQSSNFPVTSNAFQGALTGFQSGVFLKMNSSLSSLLYSTYLGGSDTDAAYVITLDTSEQYVYVGGGTSSNNFAASTVSGAWLSGYQGGLADGFISMFQNSGNYPLLRTTFIGTSAYDQVFGLKTDLDNGVYALGQTLGNFPVSSNVYSDPGSRQFIIELSPDLSTRIVSTVFGSGATAKPNISLVAFMVDTCKNIYLSGWASPSISPGTSTNNLPITSNAFQNTTDGSDFYFAVFSHGLSDLLFGSYFGAAGKPEHLDGGTSRFDPNGVVYEAICASCGNGSAFPATPGAYASQKGSNNCNLGAVKIAFELGSVNAAIDASPATGCAPLTVNFVNNSQNASSYNWSFGDGSTSGQATPSHTYTNPGTYQVKLLASNPISCRTLDSAFVTITVSDDTISPNFNFVLKDTCSNPHITLHNTSVPLQGHTLNDATFHWDFGDGSTYTGINPPDHYYTAPGAYTIRLIMSDPEACNTPDTTAQSFIFEQIFQTPDFDFPDTLCQGTAFNFHNTTVNGGNYLWQFGDGQSSDQENPGHTYNQPGTYTVTLTSTNDEACNSVAGISKTITVLNTPTALFTFSPVQPQLNVPTTFTNNSSNAVGYHWDFGDGSASEEVDPIHQFPATGTYQVCLTAYNNEGCSDQYCKQVTTEVKPLADLPTAFSPNGDGNNDILVVRGYAIKDMDLKIFNRWGQLVFESQNQNDGWDGSYQGKPQPMEAYGYSLSVTFLDGSTLKKQGNVTLVR